MKKALSIFFITGLLFAACSKSSDPADDALDKSIFAQATEAGNLDRCKDILDKNMKASCNQVITDKNITTEAVSSIDKNKCSKVENERYRKDCEKQVNEKVEAKNADTKRLTIEQNAASKGDASICDQISDNNQKISCKYNILTNLAIQKKDPSICQGIGETVNIEICQKNIPAK